MKLQFLGANQQVTGSKYLLDTGKSQVIVDCGMFQERKFTHRNWDEFPFDVTKIDAVLLTHAHIDHCGLLPKLFKEGCRAPVFMTKPTVDLLDIMLMDSARIQEEDAKYKKKRHIKEGKKAAHDYEPLYIEDDAKETLGWLHGVDYYSSTKVTDDIRVTFHDAGHILGSSSISVVCDRDGAPPITIVFSGDIGQWDKPIIRDPSLLAEADYVVIESTYGDRRHRDAGDVESQLADVISDTVKRGGKIVIPTFAVERAQELTYHIGQLVRDDRIPDLPVFLDSPMAVDVTEVFRGHRNVYDAETWDLIQSGARPLTFPGLTMSRSVKESRSINEVKGPAVIMSTSGMCTAGRIKHHLRNNIEDPNATILFVGFQGRGTLGRQILDGKEEVRIHGRFYTVKARIAQIYGFSGHADVDGLLQWKDGFKQPPRRTFITHGEKDAAEALEKQLEAANWSSHVPAYEEVVQLD